MQRREMELLADAVHLLTNDVGNLEHGALTEEQEGIDPSGKLADVSRAQEKPVAGGLRVSRGFAQGGNEESGPAMHACLSSRSQVTWDDQLLYRGQSWA